MARQPPTAPPADPTPTDALLQQLGDRLRSTPPDERAFRHLLTRQRATQRQRTLTLVLAAAGVAAVALITLREARWEAALAVFVMLFPAVALTVWAIAHQRSVLARLADRAANFLGDWRRDLRQQIRMTAAGMVAVAVFAAGVAAFALRGGLPVWQQLFAWGLVVLVIVGLGRVLLVEVRDLRREYHFVSEAVDE